MLQEVDGEKKDEEGCFFHKKNIQHYITTPKLRKDNGIRQDFSL